MKTTKPKPKGYIFGRPRNKIPTEPVYFRWEVHVAEWLREKGSKQKVIMLAEKDINKKNKCVDRFILGRKRCKQKK